MGINLESGPLAAVLLFFPLIFMLHDFEEILTVERWLADNRERLQRRLPAWGLRYVGPSLHMDTRKFAVNVLYVYILLLLAALAALFFSYYTLYLAALHVFFLHVFTHLGQSLLLRRYTPGVATAVLLVLPYSIYAYFFVYVEHIVVLRTVVESLLLLAAGFPVALGLLLWARKKQTAARH